MYFEKTRFSSTRSAFPFFILKCENTYKGFLDALDYTGYEETCLLKIKNGIAPVLK